jgi:hypothetical protein
VRPGPPTVSPISQQHRGSSLATSSRSVAWDLGPPRAGRAGFWRSGAALNSPRPSCAGVRLLDTQATVHQAPSTLTWRAAVCECDSPIRRRSFQWPNGVWWRFSVSGPWRGWDAPRGPRTRKSHGSNPASMARGRPGRFVPGFRPDHGLTVARQAFPSGPNPAARTRSRDRQVRHRPVPTQSPRCPPVRPAEGTRLFRSRIDRAVSARGLRPARTHARYSPIPSPLVNLRAMASSSASLSPACRS